tara:strand:- start:21 stop:623 length:603 start_codon:yes stop_codon:yes gene_type:complete
MKKFMVLLLSVIVVTLIAGSVQSVAADHLEPDQGIFKDMNQVNLVESKDTKYQVYLQVVIRNGDDQLVNVTESTATAAYLDHNLTDHVFDTLMGQKEIVTIDNIKYEKIQYILSPTLEERTIGYYPIFSELTVQFEVEENVYTKMNEKEKDYSIWKIHYCAEFDGHGYRCIPIFQVLMPTLTLEPSDIPTQQWTILREIN